MNRKLEVCKTCSHFRLQKEGDKARCTLMHIFWHEEDLFRLYPDSDEAKEMVAFFDISDWENHSIPEIFRHDCKCWYTDEMIRGKSAFKVVKLDDDDSDCTVISTSHAFDKEHRRKRVKKTGECLKRDLKICRKCAVMKPFGQGLDLLKIKPCSIDSDKDCLSEKYELVACPIDKKYCRSNEFENMDIPEQCPFYTEQCMNAWNKKSKHEKKKREREAKNAKKDDVQGGQG